VPNIRWLLALITAIHRFLYRVSGGRIGHHLGSRKALLLETVGRKSGKERVLPLLYVEDEIGLVVVASNAGDDRAPAWWLNLKARPEAWVQVGTRRYAVRAREAVDGERAQLWTKLVAAYAPYEEYERRTSRPIPIVVLEPAAA
jgi:deazaflavin-dependent oxidoreductase (nitroreductase family)